MVLSHTQRQEARRFIKLAEMEPGEIPTAVHLDYNGQAPDGAEENITPAAPQEPELSAGEISEGIKEVPEEVPVERPVEVPPFREQQAQTAQIAQSISPRGCSMNPLGGSRVPPTQISFAAVGNVPGPENSPIMKLSKQSGGK
jgi:hypothetical protein